MTENDEDTPALVNAMAHITEWVEAHAAYLKLIEGETDEVVLTTGESFDDAVEIADMVQECAMSVEVSSGWHQPGDLAAAKPIAFRILVTTGGPGFRVIGDIGPYGQAAHVRAEHQDWGTPWTEVDLDEEEQEALNWFAGLFYYDYGE